MYNMGKEPQMKQKKPNKEETQKIACRILFSTDQQVATIILTAKLPLTTQDVVWALQQFITPADSYKN